MDFETYKETMRIAIKNVIERQRLFSNSIQLKYNEKLKEYSVNIFEENYPAKKDIPHEERSGVYSPNIVSIKEVKKGIHENTIRIQMSEYTYKNVKCPVNIIDYTEQISKTGELKYVYFWISPLDRDLSRYFEELLEYNVTHYMSSQNSSIWCCDLCEKCSDEFHCVHENQLYATSCYYNKVHLKHGRILYGKNKNT